MRSAAAVRRNCKTSISRWYLWVTLIREASSASQVADGIRDSGTSAFNFTIEEIGYWKHNHIVYLAPREVPAELIQLVSILEDGVSNAGFSVERRPYAPHITLMRNARSIPAFALSWRRRLPGRRGNGCWLNQNRPAAALCMLPLAAGRWNKYQR